MGEERPGAGRGRSSQAAHGRLLLSRVVVEQTGPARGVICSENILLCTVEL